MTPQQPDHQDRGNGFTHFNGDDCKPEALDSELLDELTFIVYGNRINKYKTLAGSERKPVDRLQALIQARLEALVNEVIGEDDKPSWDTDKWNARQELRWEQRQRLREIL